MLETYLKPVLFKIKLPRPIASNVEAVGGEHAHFLGHPTTKKKYTFKLKSHNLIRTVLYDPDILSGTTDDYVLK